MVVTSSWTVSGPASHVSTCGHVRGGNIYEVDPALHLPASPHVDSPMPPCSAQDSFSADVTSDFRAVFGGVDVIASHFKQASISPHLRWVANLRRLLLEI